MSGSFQHQHQQRLRENVDKCAEDPDLSNVGADVVDSFGDAFFSRMASTSKRQISATSTKKENSKDPHLRHRPQGLGLGASDDLQKPAVGNILKVTSGVHAGKDGLCTAVNEATGLLQITVRSAGVDMGKEISVHRHNVIVSFKNLEKKTMNLFQKRTREEQPGDSKESGEEAEEATQEENSRWLVPGLVVRVNAPDIAEYASFHKKKFITVRSKQSGNNSTWLLRPLDGTSNTLVEVRGCVLDTTVGQVGDRVVLLRDSQTNEPLAPHRIVVGVIAQRNKETQEVIVKIVRGDNSNNNSNAGVDEIKTCKFDDCCSIMSV
eukprot:PhM_4_TR569/c0_g1_i1/m.56095